MANPAVPEAIAPLVMPRRAPAGVWRRLIKRKLALAGLIIIVVVVAGAIFAPWLTRYDPNEQMFDGLTLEGRAAAAK